MGKAEFVGRAALTAALPTAVVLARGGCGPDEDLGSCARGRLLRRLRVAGHARGGDEAAGPWRCLAYCGKLAR